MAVNDELGSRCVADEAVTILHARPPGGHHVHSGEDRLVKELAVNFRATTLAGEVMSPNASPSPLKLKWVQRKRLVGRGRARVESAARSAASQNLIERNGKTSRRWSARAGGSTVTLRFIGGSGVGYVWQQNNFELGRQQVERERRDDSGSERAARRQLADCNRPPSK
jgi:hypothetical protein